VTTRTEHRSHHVSRRVARSAGLGVVCAKLLFSSALAAQESALPSAAEPTIVGVTGGWNVNDGIWKPDAETETVGGVVLGGFVNAATSLSWFAVRAEILWTQRGLDVVDDAGAPAGSVRADYLTFALHARAATNVGPVRFHIAAGPTVDQTLQRRVDAQLGPALNREVGTAFGVHGGVGAGFTVADRYRIELEARWFEGLSDAHAGDFLSVRNRSLELLTRVGIPRPRN
jgi:hypothetical protein